MPASSSGAGREIAQWLLPVFVARFLANGNRYDTDPNTRTRFTEEDMDELHHKHDIDSEQCKRFATKAYFNHKSEDSFRKYIGVYANDEVAQVHADACDHKSDGEFDVVRKRRLMEEAEARGDCDSNDDSPEALANFEEFEAATLAALLEIHEDEVNNYSREAIEMEEAGIAYGTTGGVYFAATDALPGYIKIGCTRRHDPMVRLGELSRYVPIPFKLLFWIPTTAPFSLEAKIHRFFAAKRIRNKGAGTEFFAMASEEIHTLQPSMMVQDTKPKASRPQIQRHLQRIGFGRPAAARCSARTRR